MMLVSQAANRHSNSQLVTKSEFVNLRSELSVLEKAGKFGVLKAVPAFAIDKVIMSGVVIYVSKSRP